MLFVGKNFFSFQVPYYVYTVKLANGTFGQPIPATGRSTNPNL